MRLITNPGTNLPAAFIAEHHIEMLPQQIVVDEVFHDTRSGLELDLVDAWVADAKVHPYVLGTSAAEFASHLIRLGADDPEQLVIMTSRKMIQSHDSCVAACRTLERHPKWGHLQTRVIDSTMTDIGTGMITTYAAKARAAGFSLDEVEGLVKEFVAATRSAFVLVDLEYIVKGGQASFLKAWVAKFLGIRPIIGFVDGHVHPVGKYKVKSDPTEALTTWALGADARSTGRRVWLGVAHGQSPAEAETLADKLAAELDVIHRVVLPLTPSIYLHAGRGSLVVAITHLDALSWVPG